MKRKAESAISVPLKKVKPNTVFTIRHEENNNYLPMMKPVRIINESELILNEFEDLYVGLHCNNCFFNNETLWQGVKKSTPSVGALIKLLQMRPYENAGHLLLNQLLCDEFNDSSEPEDYKLLPCDDDLFEHWFTRKRDIEGLVGFIPEKFRKFICDRIKYSAHVQNILRKEGPLKSAEIQPMVILNHRETHYNPPLFNPNLSLNQVPQSSFIQHVQAPQHDLRRFHTLNRVTNLQTELKTPRPAKPLERFGHFNSQQPRTKVFSLPPLNELGIFNKPYPGIYSKFNVHPVSALQTLGIFNNHNPSIDSQCLEPKIITKMFY